MCLILPLNQKPVLLTEDRTVYKIMYVDWNPRSTGRARSEYMAHEYIFGNVYETDLVEVPLDIGGNPNNYRWCYKQNSITESPVYNQAFKWICDNYDGRTEYCELPEGTPECKSITKGFHSFNCIPVETTVAYPRNEEIVECTIPAGSWIYECKECDQIASNKIIINKWLYE